MLFLPNEGIINSSKNKKFKKHPVVQFAYPLTSHQLFPYPTHDCIYPQLTWAAIGTADGASSVTTKDTLFQ